MSRKVSIQSLADQLGLSKYAVSRALSGKPGVSEATRTRVLELARSMGYGKMMAAEPKVSLNRASTNAFSQFVLICMNQQNRVETNYWQRVLSGVITAAGEREWHHAIVSPSLEHRNDSMSPEETIAPYLDWSQCVGIIVMGSFPYTVLQMLAQTGHHLILVDHQEPLLHCDTIGHDNLEAGRTAVRYLQSRQCHHIGFITDDGRSASFTQRRIGIRLAAEDESSFQPVQLLEWEIPYERGSWSADLLERLNRIPVHERPTAWIGANDDIALEWMRTLQDNGYDIPDDCRIMGMDNVMASSNSSPPLSTIHLSKEEMGHRAIESLARRIDRPGTPKETVMLSTKLLPRDSA
ncbi:LacI family DNA-binding transcriptional regulator [Paenibacillus lemnae]|uniref:LacI family transcriptional regulator n=1 Tax=Paenibacillus lemnae TaxID=1330551 RepID=A0A848M9C9_PAELE|nr:LacI family DNA-binding transcriptional regulator [Paenibacillus lemnae]NMO97828.1 LacI family transcriptional regulator [Paenibacillus lemnae]